MAHAQTVRGATIRCVPLLLLLIAGFACSRQEEFNTLFRDKLAKRALACFHPLGEIKSAGPIKVGGDGFRGTIYWQGGLSGNDYETRIEAKIGTEVATIHLLQDTSPIPAAETTCLVPLEESAVPAHEEETSGEETSDEMPAETSALPDDAPPPP
ncbi:MAG TPA: hypothetical protein VN851_05660 [Thermoanaerobaculia bacterium]|nr:hypothetical protein [Thermoanaerobaculia bacterium]